MNRNKYGAHIFLWTEKWTADEIRLMERAKMLGLDILEIAIGDEVDFTPKEIRKKAEELDLEIVTSPGGTWPVEVDLSTEAGAKMGLEWHKKWIQLSAEAGATAYTGALYSHPGHIDKKRIERDDISRSASNLHQIAEYGKANNIKVVLEPMSHFRVSLINTPAQVMDLIQLSNHENLYVLLDTYHLITEVRDFGMAIDLMSPRLWGIHACENDRGCPGGGLMPWGNIFEALNRNQFKGHFILETYNSSIRNGDFAFSRGMFHNVCPDGDEFVTKGMSFLKQMNHFKN